MFLPTLPEIGLGALSDLLSYGSLGLAPRSKRVKDVSWTLKVFERVFKVVLILKVYCCMSLKQLPELKKGLLKRCL